MTDRHLRAIPDDDANPSMPHDDDAERQVLGAMLTGDRWALDAVTTILTGADYYQPRHELIHDACVHLYARGTTPEPTAVAAHLRDTKTLTQAGGAVYLHELYQGLVVAANADYHAAKILEHATRRRALSALDAAKARLLRPSDDTAAGIIDATTQALQELPLRPPGVDETATAHPWTPIDLTDILHGSWSPPQPTILQRRDGKNLLYPGAVHSIAGEPGSLKTWVGLIAAVQQIDDKHTVAMIDFEDSAGAVVARLRALGLTPDQITAHFRYIRPDAALKDTDWPRLQQAVSDTTLVILDGVTEAMVMHGWSINDNDDVARYLALLPRRIADQGPAVLQVDHVTKDHETRGRYAIGGQHKLAGITGTAMKAVVTHALAAGGKGTVKLVLDKDKHGQVGPVGTTLAELNVDATADDGTILAWLDHPTRDVDDEGNFRPTTLMKRVSDYLYEAGRPVSLRDIRGHVKGKAESIALAIDALAREGCLTTDDGPRGAVMHTLIARFEETR